MSIDEKLEELVRAIIDDGANNGVNTSTGPWVRQLSKLFNDESDVEIGKRAIRLGLMTPRSFYDRFVNHYENSGPVDPYESAKWAAGIKEDI